MTTTKIITLLTDFGLQDIYVGVMKGVIAKINPHLKIIDITHEIPSHNILVASFALMNSFAYFPNDTIYVAVVDPTVGSKRRAVAIALKNSYLIGPDNGLFSGVLGIYEPIKAIELTNSQYWLKSQPSFTFHARDIFAPVAAHLASGVSLEQLGTEIDPKTLKTVNIPEYEQLKNHFIGKIQYIDVFGNLITNIPAQVLENKSWLVVINTTVIPKGETYSSVKEGELVSLIGSHGWLEIAVNGGNAKIKLQKNLGDQIRVKI